MAGCPTRARGSADLLAVTRVLRCHGNGVPGPPLREKFRSRWRHGLQLLLCGVGGAARYPATGLVTEQGVGGEPGREPTGFGTQVPFRVGTFSTRVPGCEFPVLGRGRKGMVVVAAFLVPSSPTLVPHPHLCPPGTRVRGSGSSDHTACKGPENSARTGKFTLTGAEAPSPRRPSCCVLRCPPASARSPSGRSRPFQSHPAPCGPRPVKAARVPAL